MPTLTTQIVDAVTTDIVALNLTAFKTIRKYAPPLDILPGHLPELAVWCLDTDFQILAGGRGVETYERVHTVNIAWWVWDPKGAEQGGVGDPAIVLALEGLVQQLVNRLETYASGVPGLSPLLVGTLRSKSTDVSEGGSWQALITMTVEEAA